MITHLALSNELKHQCHMDLRRYTLEWRKEALPEAITWQDVARGCANGRIEARTGSSNPGLFCHSLCLPLVCSTGKRPWLHHALLRYADATGLTVCLARWPTRGTRMAGQ